MSFVLRYRIAIGKYNQVETFNWSSVPLNVTFKILVMDVAVLGFNTSIDSLSWNRLHHFPH